MSYLNQANRHVQHSVYDVIKLSITRLPNYISRLLLRRKSRKELASLPDYLLKDIGVSRAEAMHEAEKPFWKY
ncbi:DUF1127 domain-containing protein [Agarivorans sp. Toyoura001]|uniref:DUF1127 domain-containing protein n=1 Tax=unclassified Agarivorans TaxID=2636026 RepID=UPI0010DC7307|nr:DUF1127 domain-containing protein [Agarivorans sp. Toyoura001]GDY25479.1 hypothetical protein AHAT_13690 [Agarivorans sp. Toyoura001]